MLKVFSFNANRHIDEYALCVAPEIARLILVGGVSGSGYQTIASAIGEVHRPHQVSAGTKTPFWAGCLFVGELGWGIDPEKHLDAILKALQTGHQVIATIQGTDPLARMRAILSDCDSNKLTLLEELILNKGCHLIEASRPHRTGDVCVCCRTVHQLNFKSANEASVSTISVDNSLEI